jgi:putative oxidoreductase
MLPHGAQKLLGLFGGFGFTATMQYLTGTVGLPAPIAFLVIAAESFGALALVLGLGTRLAALGVASVMVGAVITTHLANGFFMNWMGTAAGEGFEYHLLALGLALPLVVLGGGRFALDSWLAARRPRSSALAAAALALAIVVPAPVRAEGARVVVDVVALRDCRASIHGWHATCVFEDVAPGSYAMAFLHDEDDDGDLDRDWIGMPQEGFGFSNDAPVRLGPPSFESARFAHTGIETHLRVHARYGI